MKKHKHSDGTPSLSAKVKSTAIKIHEPDENHPFQNIEWSKLNDFQKQKVLLDSCRMLDAESFCSEFESWEQPSKSYDKKNDSPKP